ncbi:exocyst complex component EXO70C1-like [Aristolochia californica]|uniref:exocyst complex component EXO70C1-like n=1 Tax=Aristolochia californica TaxID=171875 RepID=UPI0035E017EA
MDRIFSARSANGPSNKVEKATQNAHDLAETEPIHTIQEETENENGDAEADPETEVDIEAVGEAEADVEDRTEEEPTETEIDFETIFRKVFDEVDQLVEALPAARDIPDPPDVPECFEKFNRLIDEEIDKYEAEKDPGKWCPESTDESLFLDAVRKASKLNEELSGFPTGSKYAGALDRVSGTLHRAMVFLEDEFRSLLEEGRHAGDQDQAEVPSTTAALVTAKTKKLTSFVFTREQDRGNVQEPDSAGREAHPAYTPETMSRLTKIATAMISAGYVAECCHIFGIIRRWDLEESMTKLGLEKISIDDIQKMSWETLEGEITTWTKACKRCIAVHFPNEGKLCETIFSDRTEIRAGILSSVARGVVLQLLNFAEAVVLTKRSVEKLFKFLDLNEALRDLMPHIDELFLEETLAQLKRETETIRSRLGEAAVGSFSDLENSIKADSGKTPVPGGAVHPLTRYVMNYLKYACDGYKDTIEQVFQEHKKLENVDESPKSGSQLASANAPPPRSAFVVQLSGVMDLLDSSLEAKSKLYKDPSLNYIFLMNNGRYIMQKIKKSAEIHSLLGDNRKRSSELRQYHKNYTRETWSKLLACLRDDGLMQGKGTINKPALKERFKSFNAFFEEIHKTQSCWVVSDEQLQSELRVSISAVVVPAYRSFLGRFQQYLHPGRQTEKYIKFGPEEVESFIDELFDGTPVSMARRR